MLGLLNLELLKISFLKNIVNGASLDKDPRPSLQSKT